MLIKDIIKSSGTLHTLALVSLKNLNKFLDKLLNKKIVSLTESYLKKTQVKNGFENKILFVIPTLGPGGSERQLVNLVNYLSENNYCKTTRKLEIVIACLGSKMREKDFYESQLDSSVRIIKLGDEIGIIAYLKALRINYKFFWMGKNLVYLNRLDQLIMSENPKILHAWLDSACLCGGIAGIHNNIPKIVLSTRSLNPTNFLSNRFYSRSIMKRLSFFGQVKILNNSQAGARSYEDWMNLKPNKVEVIKNGFDLRHFPVNDFQRNKSNHFVIGGVMRLSHEKNIKLWIALAREIYLQKLNVKFFIIGDGPERRKLQKYIHKNQLSNYFTFLKPNSNVYQYMSQFNVLLLTSRLEGLPNVLIEAQFIGVPVISTNAGGASETFVDGVSGFLLKSFDPREFVDLIKNLVIDENLTSYLSRNAKKYAREMFDMSRIAKEYIKIYSSI
jgi:glycosyltransferase involved in cell wall biosynthesis